MQLCPPSRSEGSGALLSQELGWPCSPGHTVPPMAQTNLAAPGAGSLLGTALGKCEGRWQGQGCRCLDVLCAGVPGELLLSQHPAQTWHSDAPRGSLLGVALDCQGRLGTLQQKGSSAAEPSALGMLSDTEMGDLENPFYTGKKWCNAVLKKSELLKPRNVGNSFQILQFNRDENHTLAGGRECKSRINDALLGAVRELGGNAAEAFPAVLSVCVMPEIQKIGAGMFCSCTGWQ